MSLAKLVIFQRIMEDESGILRRTPHPL